MGKWGKEDADYEKSSEILMIFRSKWNE